MAKVYLFIIVTLAFPIMAAAQDKDTLIIADSVGNIVIGARPDSAGIIRVDTVEQKNTARARRPPFLPSFPASDRYTTKILEAAHCICGSRHTRSALF